MSDALVFANNDVVQIVWRYPAAIPGCLGFAVYRKEGSADAAGDWVPLPAWVGFEGQQNAAWTPNTTEVWPIQKFEWKDLTADRGKTYAYRIVPTIGQPSATGKLQQLADQAVETAPVTLTPIRGSFKTYFNRGILSTQSLAHQIAAGPSGAPNYQVLDDRIDQPGDPLRVQLAGQMIEGVGLLVTRVAKQGGSAYLALYELTDPELEQLLLTTPNLHLILSNTGTDDAENRPARQALHAVDGLELIDRFVPSGHLGHNKFCVYVDPADAAQAVLLGSTNWTDTALCAQSNNALVVENAPLADAYRTYWGRLKDDTPAEGMAPQGTALRQADATAALTDLPIDEGQATLWFSPNTPRARSSHPGPDEPVPPDLAHVFALMENAQQAIIFLEFEPGSPSVMTKAVEIQNANPGLWVRGAVTDPQAAGVFNTTLIHRPGAPAVEVAPATAITDQFAFWQQELLKSSPQAHAIIHDKIVVIDPFSDHCVVITGSHNQGYRASYNNDENLLIVKGHKELAAAYAVNVLDVYDHYRFRYSIQRNGTQAFSGLTPGDGWQAKYFDPADPASRDAAVWFGPSAATDQ